ncbi:hypothetical protein DIPPA_18789 [Diplonema papillatum]|nr:hypothetical protein DIPPA_18789 [Diplonema papillatum]|eukprot:gene20891-32224_t
MSVVNRRGKGPKAAADEEPVVPDAHEEMKKMTAREQDALVRKALAGSKTNRAQQVKLFVLASGLILGAALCYYKYNEIADELATSWKEYDKHCVEHTTEEACVHHLIHIRHDEQAMTALRMAGFGATALFAGCVYCLLFMTREQLNSKLL